MKKNDPIKLFKRYGFFGFFRLLVDTLQTRLFFPNARIIRRPFYVRGYSYMEIGKNFTSGVGLRLDAFSATNQKCLFIGNNVEVNDYVHIGAINSVKIGNNVLIASRVYIADHNHGNYTGENQSNPNTPPNDRLLFAKPVIIGDNVWIGENVCVLPGVTIGNGCVIGASSVVTRSIPENTIAVGSPAKTVKRYSCNMKVWDKTSYV